MLILLELAVKVLNKRALFI